MISCSYSMLLLKAMNLTFKQTKQNKKNIAQTAVIIHMLGKKCPTQCVKRNLQSGKVGVAAGGDWYKAAAAS